MHYLSFYSLVHNQLIQTITPPGITPSFLEFPTTHLPTEELLLKRDWRFTLCLGQPEPFLKKSLHPMERFAILNPYVTVLLIISPTQRIQLSSVSFKLSSQQFLAL